MVTRNAISLFTGAGGLDLGLEAAGFDLAVAVELDREAVATLRANRDWNVIDRDIHAVSTAELLREAGLREGEADLLCGGPPCQPFSKSGYWHRGDAARLNDPRAATLGAFLRVLREALPRAFLLENVPGLAYSAKDEGLLLLRDSIARINATTGAAYSLSATLVNAAEYGIPQTRERVFIVGHREGKAFRFPSPTHGRPQRADMAGVAGCQPCLPVLSELRPPTTAWDAIGHLESDDDPALAPRGKWAQLLPSIPEGSNYLFHTDRGAGLPLFGWRRHYWSMLLKLSKRRPSWTLTARPGPAIGPFHWRSRRLSSAELCALQTFPRGYLVLGDAIAAHRQLGNAVPSALAEAAGLAIRRQLFGDLDLSETPRLTLLPAPASNTPPPEETAPVPPEYLHLVGAHSAHPGTGKGYGAAKRSRAHAVSQQRAGVSTGQR